MENRYKKKLREKTSKEYWTHGYAQLLRYARTHDKIDELKDYKNHTDFNLYEWLQYFREKWQIGLLSEERIRMLKAVGVEKDDIEQLWMMMYVKARDYYDENGNMEIAFTYRTDEGILLGAWVDKQKKIKYRLSEGQKRKLDNIGI